MITLARTRLMIAQADLVELELDRERADLVSVGAAREHWNGLDKDYRQN